MFKTKKQNDCKKRTNRKNKIYFCTFTCFKWYNLFEITKLYDYIYNWFDLINQKYENQILGYVIMPNHIHFLIFINEKSPNLNLLIGNCKRFLAYEIVKRLTEQKNLKMLSELENAVSNKEKLKGKKHQVFETSFDSKICFTNDFILQKLNYMHQNPMQTKWDLVEDTIEYLHSSAKFYETGEHSIYCVKNYLEAGN